MTLSKVKLGDCPPPPLHPPPPPPPHPHHVMATHQPLYQHRLRLQQQSTEDNEGVEMTCTGRSFKAGAGGGGQTSAASLILHHRPPWHIKDEVLPQVSPSLGTLYSYSCSVKNCSNTHLYGQIYRSYIYIFIEPLNVYKPFDSFSQ